MPLLLQLLPLPLQLQEALGHVPSFPPREEVVAAVAVGQEPVAVVAGQEVEVSGMPYQGKRKAIRRRERRTS